MKGDKFDFYVSSFYQTATPTSPTGSPLNSIVSGLINGVSGSAVVNTHGITSSQFQSSGVLNTGVTQFLGDQPDNSGGTKPLAYVNWVLLDEQFNLVRNSSSFEQVNAQGVIEPHFRENLPITQSGYLYIYVSNNTPNIPVYFDNLKVKHTRGALLETNEFYPYGLKMASISYKASMTITNRHGFNAGNEYEDEGELNYSTTFYRKYDAQIGRFTGVDMLAEETNTLAPYNFGNGNPVMFNDPTGALNTLSNGRSTKGPDGQYHTGWVTEMLWGNLGFYSDDYWGGSGGGGGGGAGGGSNYRNFMGMNSSSILNKMGLGQSFGRNESGQYGFTGGVVTTGMVTSYYQQLWGSLHSERGNINARDAHGKNQGLGFNVGWSSVSNDLSVIIGSMFLSNDKAQNLFFAYTNISALVVDAFVNGIGDVGHTALQIGETIYGYYPKNNGSVFFSKGSMHQNTREEFDVGYKQRGYIDFTLKITNAQANLVGANMSAFISNPGYYSIFGQQCTNIAFNALVNGGVNLQIQLQTQSHPEKYSSWSMMPSEFREILRFPINSSIVIGQQYYSGP